MRRFVFTAATLVLIVSLGCRKQRTNETAGVSDTTTPPAATAEPVPAAADTTSAPAEFTFDQRQNFAQSIRQQLADIDRQIKELSAQAKSRGGAVSDRALNNVRAARRAVERDLNRVNAATAANWDQIKQGVTRAVENLNEAIEVAQPK
jgi:small-conductance mechanosensitive channel